MAVKNLKEKLDKIAISDSTWLEEAKWRKENREWLIRSATIAVRVLRVLREKNMPKAELARLMNVSPQRVTAIVKGQENFTLDTISKLEKVLEVKLMDIPQQEFIYPEIKLTESPWTAKAGTMDMGYTLSDEMMTFISGIVQKSTLAGDYKTEETDEYNYSEAA